MTLLAGLLGGGELPEMRVKAGPLPQADIYLPWHRRAFLNDLQELSVVVDGSTDVTGYFGPPRAMAGYLESYAEHYTLARSLQNYARKKPVGYIANVHVPRERRGGGLGRLLMVRWIVEARARGVGDIYLWAYAYKGTGGITTDKLVKFYESLGFVVEPKLDDDDGKTIMVLKAGVKIPSKTQQLPLDLQPRRA